MSAPDLAGVIADQFEVEVTGEYDACAIWATPAEVSDAILAAGYQKPRTVTTAEDLRSLNEGAVLMSGDRLKMYDGAIWRVSGGMIVRVGKELNGVVPFRYFIDPLPATVIHEPTP